MSSVLRLQHLVRRARREVVRTWAAGTKLQKGILFLGISGFVALSVFGYVHDKSVEQRPLSEAVRSSSMHR